jgi:hypothetical protein
MSEAMIKVMIEATRASGVIVQVDWPAFLWVLERQQNPLVVHATGGFFRTSYKYLTSYKGLAFYAKLSEPQDLPPGTEVVHAKSIWVPS